MGGGYRDCGELSIIRPVPFSSSEFRPCSVCQPAKSAGPFLYENEDAMPRAWIVRDATTVLGDSAERLAVTYRLLDQPDFDPRRTVIVHAELPASAPRPSQTQGVPHEEPLGTPVPPVIESYRGHSVRIRLAGQRGYLVLAEKFAHFPGWRASSAAGPRPLVKANGVATAIPLDGTKEWIELRYWPTGHSRPLSAPDPAPAGSGFLAGAGDYKANAGGGSLIQSGVMFRNSRIRMDDLLDGAAQTILLGESSGRQSDGRWADASHCCVHTQGALRRNPAYWTSEHSGVHFLFGDGSVRLLSDSVRPEVLAALATRNGREKLGVGDF
jgi:hypothetical protein